MAAPGVAAFPGSAAHTLNVKSVSAMLMRDGTPDNVPVMAPMVSPGGGAGLVEGGGGGGAGYGVQVEPITVPSTKLYAPVPPVAVYVMPAG